MRRKALTPVIAIVLFLLLAVTATGAAYGFVSTVIEEKQEEARRAAATDLSVRDVQCRGINATFKIQNAGDRGLETDVADAFLYDSAGTLLDQATADIAGAGFTTPDGFGSTFATFSQTMEKYRQYRIELELTDDEYTVRTQCEATRTMVGEAFTVNVTDTGWETVSFLKPYDNPVILATTNTKSTSQNPVIPQARSINSSAAEVRLCEHDNVDSCENFGEERLGVAVFENDTVNELNGVEAGVVNVSAGGGSPEREQVDFADSFSKIPTVFVTLNTLNEGSDVSVWVYDNSTTDFTVGRCNHSESDIDQCGPHSSWENVGWMAVNPENNPFANLEVGKTDLVSGGGTWETVSFSSLPEPVVGMGMMNGQEGGQDAPITETRRVNSGSLDVRFCEHDQDETCDGHMANFLGWFAASEGMILH